MSRSAYYHSHNRSFKITLYILLLDIMSQSDAIHPSIHSNVITMITPEEEISLDLMSKEEAAGKILDEILKLRG